jgi:hypothetical protein
MYTLDEFIERMIELRTVATAGGETWVLMQAGRHLEHIGIELQNATPTHDESGKWTVKHKHNTSEVVRVF